MLTSFLYLAYCGVWFLIQLYKKKKLKLKDRSILFIASLCFPIMVGSFGMALSDRLTCGDLTFFSGLFYVSSLLMACFTAWSIFRSFKLIGKRSFKAFYYFCTFAICVVTIFFIHHDFIGLKLWSY